MTDYIYETTPYGVEKHGRTFVVRKCWWGKDISTHKSQEEADAACVEEARRAGCLTRVRIRPAKRKAAKR